MSKIQQTINTYEKACNDLIILFCNKQDLEFDGFVGDEIGGTASFAESYFFNLSDIIHDLKTNQKKGLILDWQIEDVEHNLGNENPKHINYKSYTMGLRF
jgi:hypothetical protein